MSISSWCHISETENFLNPLFFTCEWLWFLSRAVCFCLTPAATAISVPPCLCSNEYTSRICVCTLRNFSFDKVLEMSRDMYTSKTMQIAKLQKHWQLCQFTFASTGYLDTDEWSWILLLPAVIEAACSPHLANTRHHHWFSSLPTWEVKKRCCIAFLRCISLVTNEVNVFFPGQMTILTSFLKYLFTSFAHWFWRWALYWSYIIFFPICLATLLTVIFENQFSFLYSQI